MTPADLAAAADNDLARALWAGVTTVNRVPGLGDCWEWEGTRHNAGYGLLRWAGKSTYAHRLAFTLTKGPIPVGLMVRHDCDVPPCCNPNHLRLGTHAENQADKGARGRSRGAMDTQRAKTHCPMGHAYSPENTYITTAGGRRCRTCGNAAARAYQMRKRGPPHDPQPRLDGPPPELPPPSSEPREGAGWRRAQTKQRRPLMQAGGVGQALRQGDRT